MNTLTINDIKQILALAKEMGYNQYEMQFIKDNLKILNENSSANRPLSQQEINHLATNNSLKLLMILYFLTKNVALEFLRRQQENYKGKSVKVKNLWKNIQSTIKNKLFLSRAVRQHFNVDSVNADSLENFVNAAQILEFDDLMSEEFVNDKDGSIFRLYITGKYEFINAGSSNVNDEYTLHDRKTCFHEGIFDPFKFEEQQTWASYRYLNTSAKRKAIDSIFTVKFATPELTVLNLDLTYSKISTKDIPDFLEKNLINNEIDSDLYEAIKKDYPKLFLPSLESKTINNLYQRISQLLEKGLRDSAKDNKPLLILLSEVHGSKESFLLHIIILHIAFKIGVKNLLVETINIYHEKYGWDAKVEEIIKTIDYAKEKLGFEVSDLEKELHYKNIRSPYPYHDIPEADFGMKAREESWIEDAEKINTNQVMIVGSGHLNNLLNSRLRERYYILPIDCSGDKEFSDMLSISQHNFISIDKKLNPLSLNEIIEKVEGTN